MAFNNYADEETNGKDLFADKVLFLPLFAFLIALVSMCIVLSSGKPDIPAPHSFFVQYTYRPYHRYHPLVHG